MMALMADDDVDSDETLIADARSGDRRAFAQLIERHYDFMFRVAWKWCGRKNDAEDIAQEAAVRLGKAIRSFRG